MLKKAHVILIFLLNLTSFGFPFVINAQNGQNPFDIKNQRLIEQATSPDTASEQKPTGTGNPFDLLAPAKNTTTTVIAVPVIPTITPQSQSLQDKGQNFLFAIVLSVVIFLTILVTMSRSLLSRIYKAFYSDVVLKTLYREKGSLTTSIYIALYMMFLLNMGVFLFLLLYNHNQIFNHSELFTLLYAIAGVFILFVGKHLILRILSFVFPVSQEINLYGFIILIFGIFIGLLLAPINVFLAYSEPAIAKTIILCTSFLIGAIYIFRSLRSLILAGSYIIPHFFHFLLYLCAVEIAPVLILMKIISSKMQIPFF